MAPYVGEIRMFAGTFAPAEWMLCEGQILPISENETLFMLIGTTYGGDGQSTFALPDLRGRLPVHQGSGYVLGGQAGMESVTLTVQQIPAHTHAVMASTSPASSTGPGNQVLALTQAATVTPYGTDAPLVALAPSSISSIGGSQTHDNMQPYLCVNYIISMFGLFPSRS